MSTSQEHRLHSSLEDACWHNHASYSVSERLALTSIAVSLKRLADVAEATAMGLWNYDPTLTPDGKPRGEQP